MLKVIEGAALMAEERLPWHMVLTVMSFVAVAAREPARHESLLASGVVQPLLYATANEVAFMGVSIAEKSAAAAVALIGRNESKYRSSFSVSRA